MEVYRCSVCDGLVFFDNSLCLACGTSLGFDPDRREIVALTSAGAGVAAADDPSRTYRMCANQIVARCNWLVDGDDPEPLCRSCRLTSVRPSDADADAIAAFAHAESAKRRLLYQLGVIGLTVVDRATDPDNGLTFELLSSRGRPVTTGHQGGVVTLDLSESDDAHREFVRQQLGEPYRTVLGHLRHEIAHYFWPGIVLGAGFVDEFRSVFGDERTPYAEALQIHYDNGTPPGWETNYVSQYATAHPWEDWAETFAHYLHIHAGLQTAASFGLAIGEPSMSAGLAAWSAPQPVSIGDMIGRWLAVAFALNGMSRSIGQGDLYPFVLSPAVVAKLDVVHRSIRYAVTGVTS